MNTVKLFVIYSILVASTVAAIPASAQGIVIGADQVREWMNGGKEVLLIDVRTPEEYRKGHIPGAVNIPAERVIDEQAKLPKDRTTPLIFYCRGTG